MELLQHMGFAFGRITTAREFKTAEHPLYYRIKQGIEVLKVVSQYQSLRDYITFITSNVTARLEHCN